MIAPEDLRRYTAKIYCPGKSSQGTGFWVGARWVLTCSHVVRDVGPDLFLLGWDGAELGQATVVDRCETTDVALLAVAETGAPLQSLTQPIAAKLDDMPVRPGDRVSLYGYSDETPEGEPATFEVEGITGQNFIKFKQGQVRPGMSGAPLLNLRTGRVCGMVKFTRDRSQALGGGAIPMAVILARLPQLVQVSRAVPNPFGATGVITDPSQFWGRQELLRQVFEELAKGGSRALIGPAGSGKSSILQMICQLGSERLGRSPSAWQGQSPEQFIYLDMSMVRDEADFFEALCEELRMPSGKQRQIQRELENRQRPHVLCLDEIHALTREAYFPEPTRDWLRGMADLPRSPLQLVVASQRELRELFPDSSVRSSPLADFFDGQTTRLEYLSEAEVMAFWQEGLAGTGVVASVEQGRLLWAESRGNLRQLQRAAAKLYDECSGGR